MLTLEAALDLFGEERLVPYLNASSGNIDRALILYLWNSKVAGSYWAIVESIEVVLRYRLASALFSDGLVTQSYLDSKTTGAFKISKPAQKYTEMTFGFWTYLLSPQNANAIWTPVLHRSFQKGVSRKALHLDVSAVQKLRNKIGHHEAIWHLDHELILSKIYAVLAAISDDAVAWVESTTNIQAVLDQRPTWLPRS